MGKGWGCPTKMSQPGGSMMIYDVNLNESQWLLVPPPSDVELPEKTDFIRHGIMWFNMLQ